MTPDELRAAFAYDPNTGKLFWKVGRRLGKEAFTATSHGYRVGTPFGKGYPAHRVIWAIMTGEWPSGEIDHDNGIRSDNRWTNLKDVTRGVNALNKATPRNNTSGAVGVSYHKAADKWVARIKRTYLGIYETKAEAMAVRKQAEVSEGFNPNHGRFTATLD